MYSVLVTTAGATKLASGLVNLTDFAIGDAGGTAYVPTGAEVALVNERQRVAISGKIITGNVVTVVGVFETPATSYTAREAGIFDVDGDLIYILNLPDRLMPATSSGANLAFTLNAVIAVSNINNLTITVDGSAYVTQAVLDAAMSKSLQTKVSNYTMTAADDIIVLGANNLTITLPDATAVEPGQVYKVKAGDFTGGIIATQSGQTVDGTTPPTLNALDSLHVYSDSVNWLID